MPEDLVYRQACTFLIFPVQSPFPNNIYEADKEKGNKHQYRHKPVPSKSTKIDCIRIKEYDFHIKQYKQNGHQKVFYSHWLTSIPELLYTTFKNLKFINCLSFRAKQAASKDHDRDQTNCKNQLNSDREIITCPADLIDLT